MPGSDNNKRGQYQRYGQRLMQQNQQQRQQQQQQQQYARYGNLPGPPPPQYQQQQQHPEHRMVHGGSQQQYYGGPPAPGYAPLQQQYGQYPPHPYPDSRQSAYDNSQRGRKRSRSNDEPQYPYQRRRIDEMGNYSGPGRMGHPVYPGRGGRGGRGRGGGRGGRGGTRGDRRQNTRPDLVSVRVQHEHVTNIIPPEFAVESRAPSTFASSTRRDRLVTNLLPVNLNLSSVRHYHVSFDPPIEGNERFDGNIIRRILVEREMPAMLKKLEDPSKAKDLYAYDGESMLLLPCAGNESIDLASRFDIHTKFGLPKQELTDHTIKFQLVSKLGEVSSEASDLPAFGGKEHLNALTSLFRSSLRSLGHSTETPIMRMGKDYFFPMSKIVTDGVRILPGLTMALQNSQRGLFLRVDTIFKSIQNKTVWDEMQEYMATHNQTGVELALGIGNGFKGRPPCIITEHNGALYRVDKIMWDMSPLDSFTMSKSKETITFAKYFKAVAPQLDPNQPLLKVSRRKNDPMDIFIPPSLARFTVALQEGSRVDTGGNTRMRQIQTLVDVVTSTVEARLHSYGVTIGKKFTSVDVPQLPTPVLSLGRNAVAQADKSTFNLKNHSLIESKKLRKVFLLYGERNGREADKFVRSLEQVYQPLTGYRLENVERFPARDIAQGLDEILRRFDTEGLSTSTAIVIALLPEPTRKSNMYENLKFKCVQANVISQMALIAKLRPGKDYRSIATKIVIQMQSKLGGKVYTSKQLLDLHRAGQHRGLSFAAVVESCIVGTTNIGSTDFLTCDIELTPDSREGLKSALDKFKSEYNALQAHEDDKLKCLFIFVEREQVGKLLQDVLEEENINSVLVLTCSSGLRFFSEGSDGTFSSASGVGISNEIAEKDTFYMSPCNAPHGKSSTVMKFQLLHNSAHLDFSVVQEWSYQLLYLYSNWQGLINHVAPLKYAKTFQDMQKKLAASGRIRANGMMHHVFYI